MFRVGLGYDIHQTNKKGSICIIGGVPIPCQFSLVGYSDADVLLHAITDAILGAIGMGDIGEYFPNENSENYQKDSSQFLLFAYNKSVENGYSIANIDCNIICEKPKIYPFKKKICENVATILKIDTNQINIKAKTNEKLDSIGKGKAISCQSVVLLYK